MMTRVPQNPFLLHNYIYYTRSSLDYRRTMRAFDQPTFVGISSNNTINNQQRLCDHKLRNRILQLLLLLHPLLYSYLFLSPAC